MATIGVLACSKRKLPYAAPAVELYQGDVFRLARTYLASIGCERIVVLSALHGAVPGDRVVAPYDRTLAGQPWLVRREWAERAREQLRALVPDGARVVAIVPKLYAAALEGIPHERHFGGLSIGWLKHDLARALPRPAGVR